jgi:mannose-6-phosphate isomerase-like protein (cupin superfamily)
MPWLDSIAAAITMSVQWLCSIVSAIALAVPTAMAVAEPHSDTGTHSRYSAASAASASAVFVTPADVMATVKKLSPTFTDDEPIRVIAAGANRIGVFVVGRPKKTGPVQSLPGGAVQVTEGLELDQVSAVVRVLVGAGTMVTGGTLIDSQRMPANDPDVEVIGPGRRGKSILGGNSRRLSAGDMVIIPAGVPHGFSEIEQPITYVVIRVDTGRVLPLK